MQFLPKHLKKQQLCVNKNQLVHFRLVQYIFGRVHLKYYTKRRGDLCFGLLDSANNISYVYCQKPRSLWDRWHGGNLLGWRRQLVQSLQGMVLLPARTAMLCSCGSQCVARPSASEDMWMNCPWFFHEATSRSSYHRGIYK